MKNLRTVIIASLISAIGITLIGAFSSHENPLWLLQAPGWALAFGLFFTAADTPRTTILQGLVYWGANLGLWFGLIFIVSFLGYRIRDASRRYDGRSR
jgi:hypothetical protein